MFPIKIVSMPGHNAVKEMILSQIEETDSFIIHGHGDEYPPLTDWEKYDDCEWEDYPSYWHTFHSLAEELILDVVHDEFGYEEATFGTFWFQQYETKGEHDWHMHPQCLYHAIYYLELPRGTPPTLCRMPGGFEFTPNVEEGDILIMPSIIEHTSPKNRSRNRKTVIAMNIDNYD